MRTSRLRALLLGLALITALGLGGLEIHRQHIAAQPKQKAKPPHYDVTIYYSADPRGPQPSPSKGKQK